MLKSINLKEVTLLNSRKMKNIIKCAAIVLSIYAAALLSGCGSKEAEKFVSAEERFALGMKYFNDEDYLEAIDEFKVVSLQHQGSKVAESAQFYMAESRFNREEYILAAFEYDILLNMMHSSVFVPLARFKRATCYYELSPKSYLDQNYTQKAIDEYQEFLEYHSADTLAPVAEKRIIELNTKMAKKDFENGMTYMHMYYYKAATYYFDQVLEKYHDTEYAEQALFRKAEALLNRNKFADARESVDKFLAKYPGSPLKSEAEALGRDIVRKQEAGREEELKMEQKKPMKGGQVRAGS
jgi:outer membrane protein assembly factor BamD